MEAGLVCAGMGCGWVTPVPPPPQWFTLDSVRLWGLSPPTLACFADLGVFACPSLSGCGLLFLRRTAAAVPAPGLAPGPYAGRARPRCGSLGVGCGCRVPVAMPAVRVRWLACVCWGGGGRASVYVPGRNWSRGALMCLCG